MSRTFAPASIAAFVLGLVVLASEARSDSPSSALAESYRLHSSGDVAGAVRAMTQVVAEQPRQYFPRLRLAYLQFMAADYSAAAQNYAQAVELKPSAVEAVLGEQQALLAAGRYAEAEPLARQVLKEDPKSYLGNSRLAWTLYNLKRFDEAAAQYTIVLAMYPSDIEMRIGLGYSQLGGGHKAEASKTFREVLEMVPDNKSAVAGLAASR
jgi:tetratricopeptide (TPR) repeat protein